LGFITTIRYSRIFRFCLLGFQRFYRTYLTWNLSKPVRRIRGVSQMITSRVVIFSFSTFFDFVARNFAILTLFRVPFVPLRVPSPICFPYHSIDRAARCLCRTIRANHTDCDRFCNFSIPFFKMDYVGLPAHRMCTME